MDGEFRHVRKDQRNAVRRGRTLHAHQAAGRPMRLWKRLHNNGVVTRSRWSVNIWALTKLRKSVNMSWHSTVDRIWMHRICPCPTQTGLLAIWDINTQLSVKYKEKQSCGNIYISTWKERIDLDKPNFGNLKWLRIFDALLLLCATDGNTGPAVSQ